MITLDQRIRSSLAVAAVLCFISAFAGAPLHARGALDDLAANPPDTEIFRPKMPATAIVTAQRDPFAGNDDDRTIALTPVSATSFDAPAPLPNNLLGDPIPFLPMTPGLTHNSEEHIAAVMTGDHPSVLLTSGSSAQILGLGDRIEGEPIDEVTVDGVRLHSGKFLKIAAPISTKPAYKLPREGPSR